MNGLIQKLTEAGRKDPIEYEHIDYDYWINHEFEELRKTQSEVDEEPSDTVFDGYCDLSLGLRNFDDGIAEEDEYMFECGYLEDTSAEEELIDESSLLP